jgi:sterol 3beta-glucosyltransferase
MPIPGQDRTNENSLKQPEIILDYFFTPLAADMFAASERLCRENDAIIGHPIHSPIKTAAERAGKPYAT